MQSVSQERVVRILSNAVKNDKIANAYLFVGSSGVGKADIARLFAKALNCLGSTEELSCNCKHCSLIEKGAFADFVEIFPDGTKIKVDQIRELKSITRFGPVAGRKLCVIVHRVEDFTAEAGNSFLKLLEEPSPDVVFVLLAANRFAILPTIISRCQVLTFSQLPAFYVKSILQSRYQMSSDELDFVVDVAGGELLIGEMMADAGAKGISLLEDFNKILDMSVFEIMKYAESIVLKEKDSIKDIINLYILHMVSRLKSGNLCSGEIMTLRKCIQICMDTLKNLKNNINVRLHIESMMLQLRFAK